MKYTKQKKVYFRKESIQTKDEKVIIENEYHVIETIHPKTEIFNLFQPCNFHSFLMFFYFLKYFVI